MKHTFSLLLVIVATFIATGCFAQGATFAVSPALSGNTGRTSGSPGAHGPEPDAKGWSDPALNHSRLLRDRLGEGTFVLIGAFKVTGSPYLFGQRVNADLFSQKETAKNIDINYNTYNQDVEFYSTSNPNTALTKAVGEVDSFILKQKLEADITEDLKFIYGPLLGSTEKVYFQEVSTGAKFSVYKRYKSEIGYPAGSLSQGDIRQFDMTVEYYYYDAVSKKLKKLKPGYANLLKQFETVTNAKTVVTAQEYQSNPDAALKRFFNFLNS